MPQNGISVYESLLQGSLNRRATALEEFLREHTGCGAVGPVIKFSDSSVYDTVTASCFCGKIAELTIQVSLDIRVRRA